MDEATAQQIVSLLTEIRDTLKAQGMVTASASSGKFGDEAPAKRYQNADGEWVYEVPKHKKASKCRSCQGEIWWVKTKNGKNVPVNNDGVCHFDTCPDRKESVPASSAVDADVPF
jgi:hypothetical protein